MSKDWAEDGPGRTAGMGDWRMCLFLVSTFSMRGTQFDIWHDDQNKMTREPIAVCTQMCQSTQKDSDCFKEMMEEIR